MKESVLLSWMLWLFISIVIITICEKHHNYINNNSIKAIKNHKRISLIIYIAKFLNMIFGNVPYMRVYTWFFKIRHWNMIFWYFGIFKYRKGIFKYRLPIFKYSLDFDLNFVQETVFDYKCTVTSDRSLSSHFILLSSII